jgi:GNAT superfamily N-acetyltransferase
MGPASLYQFKLVEATQLSIIHNWLKQPHIAKWFYGQGLSSTLEQLNKFIEGTSWGDYWLIYDKNHPFGLFITSYINKSDDEFSKWCHEEGEAITLDMLIGDPNYLGKGLAHQLIQQFLITQFPTAVEVLIDPQATNERAIHVYKKAGFEMLGEYLPNHSPNLHYMMRLNMKKLQSMVANKQEAF